jgi:formylglycine-generating enzyme required for sulfatase activity
MCTWCLNEVEAPYQGHRAVRGVAWSSPSMETTACIRQGYTPSSSLFHIGLRLAARPLAW